MKQMSAKTSTVSHRQTPFALQISLSLLDFHLHYFLPPYSFSLQYYPPSSPQSIPLFLHCLQPLAMYHLNGYQSDNITKL